MILPLTFTLKDFKMYLIIFSFLFYMFFVLFMERKGQIAERHKYH